MKRARLVLRADKTSNPQAGPAPQPKPSVGTPPAVNITRDRNLSDTVLRQPTPLPPPYLPEHCCSISVLAKTRQCKARHGTPPRPTTSLTRRLPRTSDADGAGLDSAVLPLPFPLPRPAAAAEDGCGGSRASLMSSALDMWRLASLTSVCRRCSAGSFFAPCSSRSMPLS